MSGVNDLGRITERLWPIPESGCWVWDGCVSTKGYPKFWFSGKSDYGHRVAYRIWRGEIPEGAFVCHTCDNRACMNPDHLFISDNSGNRLDMIQKKRHPHGESHYLSKLTDEKVVEGRRRYYYKREKIESISLEYGVGFQTMWNAIVGNSWKHVAMPDTHGTQAPDSTD